MSMIELPATVTRDNPAKNPDIYPDIAGPWQMGHMADGERFWIGRDHEHVVAFVDRDQANIARAICAIPDMIDALNECEELLEGWADADFEDGRYVGNPAMRLLMTVRDAMAKAGA